MDSTMLKMQGQLRRQGGVCSANARRWNNQPIVYLFTDEED